MPGSLEELREAATDELRARAAELGLEPSRIELRYVLNWGGFVNASFTVQDGARRHHLKLAGSAEDRERLARWRVHGERLAALHRAPRIAGWVDLGTWAGILFEHLEGRVDDPLPARHLPTLLATVGGLHADHELAERLPPRLLRASFLDYFVECCAADLAEMEERPPFVDEATFAWMQSENERLRRAIQECAAFDGEAQVAVHGDLWAGNVLVTGDGRPYVLDWDELARGDPALDYLLLLGDRLGAVGEERALLQDRDAAFLERFALGRRALLLTNVVDSLADWIDARRAPEHTARVRRCKRALHERSLRDYRERYDPDAPPPRPGAGC